MTIDRPTLNVLFVCTGNSARSILAESILNHPAIGQGRFRAFSAGSHPAGHVQPLALALLAQYHYPTDGLRSKNWDEFSGPSAPRLDFVFTVCDRAAGEACPYWPGQPMTAHWGVPDPAAVEGSDEDKRKAFVAGRPLALTPIEFRLLLRLAGDAGNTHSREALLTDVWGVAPSLEVTRTVADCAPSPSWTNSKVVRV